MSVAYWLVHNAFFLFLAISHTINMTEQKEKYIVSRLTLTPGPLDMLMTYADSLIDL